MRRPDKFSVSPVACLTFDLSGKLSLKPQVLATEDVLNLDHLKAG
jgi:hypothetical protein